MNTENLELLKAIEGIVKTQVETVLEEKLESKFGSFRQEMMSEMGSLRQEMDVKMDNLRQDMRSEMGSLRQEMDTKMDTKMDTLRHNIMLDFNTVIENKVSKEIRLIAEQHNDIVKRLAKVDHLDPLEDRVSILESTVRGHTKDILVLQRA